MKKGFIGSLMVMKNTDHFDVSGMVSPNFINNGNTPVKILYQTVQPGGNFLFEFPFIIENTTVPILFVEDGVPDPVNQVTVVFGKYADKDKPQCTN